MFNKSNKNNSAPDRTPEDKPESFRLISNRIKPHFINNILSSIYYLCDMDPQRAQSITMDLSGYMLGTLGSLDNPDPVPFESELELAKKYLSLEKLRFDDRLHVTYDIDVDDFRLPPLTLQPIVENSVKHGIAENGGSGSLQIVTRRISGGTEIRVIDDGVGFDTGILKAGNLELNQIEERLRQHGDELTIVSMPGNGTSVTVTIRN